MNSFLELHGLSISGTINTFDRVIFKGHLNGFFPIGSLRAVPVAAGCSAQGRRPVLRGRDAADPGPCRFGCGGGGAAGRVPGGCQHASLGQLEGGSSAGDCRAGRSDGRAGVCTVGGRALPVVHGRAEPADPAPGGGPPTAQVPAPLSVLDRSRIRLDARAPADLGALRDPGLRQRPRVAGAADGPGRPRISALRQQDHAGR